MNKINDEDVTRYIKHLVSMSEAAYVADDFTVVDANGKTLLFDNKPAKIFSTKLVSGEYHLLNPFKETAQVTSPQKWLTDMMIFTLEECVRQIMLDVLDTILDGTIEVPINKMKLTSKFVKDVNKTSVAQAKKILKIDGAVISTCFLTSTKISQLQTKLFDDDFHKEFGKNISKKTWELLQKLFCEITGADDFHKYYQEKSTVIGMARFETFLKLFTKLVTKMHPHLVEWLECDLNPKLLNEMCSNLMLCQKLSAYMVIPTPKDAAHKPSNIAPWEKVINPVAMGNSISSPQINNNSTTSVSKLPTLQHVAPKITPPKLTRSSGSPDIKPRPSILPTHVGKYMSSIR